MGLLRDLWDRHGTKILGAGGIFLSTISLIDQETVHLVADLFGPLWAPRITHGFAIFGGILTAFRGVANTRKNDGTPN